MTIGLAVCGSFCTIGRVTEEAERLAREFDVTALLSEHAANTDTRFGRAEEVREKLAQATGRPVLTGLAEAEPIGPKDLFDVLVIAPCTGNTLSKLACGVTDTTVTMAAKSQLRGGKPVVIALATNDGLAASAGNIGTLLARKNVYFVPFSQDDPEKKPRSLVADFSRIRETALAAAEGRQVQPIIG